MNQSIKHIRPGFSQSFWMHSSQLQTHTHSHTLVQRQRVLTVFLGAFFTATNTQTQHVQITQTHICPGFLQSFWVHSSQLQTHTHTACTDYMQPHTRPASEGSHSFFWVHSSQLQTHTQTQHVQITHSHILVQGSRSLFLCVLHSYKHTDRHGMHRLHSSTD